MQSLDITSLDINQALDNLKNAVSDMLSQRKIDKPFMIGIHTGGVWIAEYLHQQLAIDDPLGSLDISFYRDDFTRKGVNPVVKPSVLPQSVDDRHILIVDDVLHTGRTVRAAMNEIFDYGRPASILFVCLVQRSGLELPIAAHAVGLHLEASEHQQIKLKGPEPLKLVLQDISTTR